MTRPTLPFSSISGPGCSKLTTSLVNDSLKFTSSDTQIRWNLHQVIRKYAEIFCWKNVSSFCSAKATHIFSAKNIRILYTESAKTVNEMTLNELVKLTTLWTTGPWLTMTPSVIFSSISDKLYDLQCTTIKLNICFLPNSDHELDPISLVFFTWFLVFIPCL